MGIYRQESNERLHSVGTDNDDDERDSDDKDEAPETPLDEPPPAQIQDPPSEPQQRGPYVVNAGGSVNTERKERRGFASMSPEKQREIASKGGRAAHEKGTAHEWTADEARSAGRRGGQVSRGGRGRLVASEGEAAPQNAESPTAPARFPPTRVE